MDNNEVQGIKFSQFPSSTPTNTDTVVGLHAGANARFTFANIIAAVRAGLSNIFVPKTDVGSAKGVAELDATGKVPSSQLPAIPSTAAAVTYDNTDSGLTADNVQDAIDELADGAGGGGVDPETIAPVETSTTATVAHPLGSIFYLNDALYRALADIAVGGTINTGTGGNATQTTVAQNFKRTVTLTAAEYAQLSAAEKAADIVYIITDDNSIAAEDVSYNNTSSGLTATNVQAAIDEVYGDIPTQAADIGALPSYGMGENLLDNWYFGNPVNRRGSTSFSGGGANYFLDRWRKINSLAGTSDGGFLHITNTNWGITQLGIFPAGTYTFSMLAKNFVFPSGGSFGLNRYFDAAITGSQLTGNSWGLYTYSFSATSSFSAAALQFNSNTGSYSIDILAVKLELGTEQTLCHNEGTDANPVWVLNEIPDYEEELIKCQTSIADSTDTYANKSLATEQQLAYVESGTTASRAYAVGEYFCWNGLLYRVKTAISSGGDFNPGTNCVQDYATGDSVTPTISTTQTNYTVGNLSLRSVGGMVIGYAEITPSTPSSGTVIGTLPSAFVPASNKTFLLANSNGSVMPLQFRSGGNIYALNGTAGRSYSGSIVFPIGL